MKKLLSFVLCAVLIGSVAVPAFAADTAVDYCRVKIVVDGATIVPKDADGKPVEPFIYDGTTYLPVRSVANALGLEVGWEPGTVKLTSGAERTAAIGKPTESQRTCVISIGGQDTKVTLDGKELTLKDAAGNPVTPIISGGVTYLPVRAIADALHVPVLWDGETATVYLGEAIEWKVVKEVYTPGDDSGETIEYTYDDLGRETSVSTQYADDPDKRDISRYAYDDAGNMIWRESDFSSGHFEERWSYNKDGQRISYTYNPLNGGTDGYTKTYTYDEYGSLTVEHCDRVDGDVWDNTYTNEYNADAQLIRWTKTTDKGYIETTTYTYDSYGNLTGRHYSDSKGIEESEFWTYDAAGNLLEEKTQDASFSQRTVYTYDAMGNVLSETQSETSASGGESITMQTQYVYDDRGNLLEQKWTNSNGSRYKKYIYDQFNNCIEETTEYDGMISKTVYAYSEGNLLLSIEINGYKTVYTYDQYGNRLTEGSSEAEYITTYTYTPIYK